MKSIDYYERLPYRIRWRARWTDDYDHPSTYECWLEEVPEVRFECDDAERALDGLHAAFRVYLEGAIKDGVDIPEPKV
jgi:hypothetical protein